MAKLGDFEFPEVELADSIELARRIHEDLSGEVRRDGLAMILDMSPTGGAYGARIGALRMWGLATGRSIIKLTSDAEKLASSADSNEESVVITTLARSVPLFNELQDRLGDGSLDQRVLTVMLQEITGAEMDEITRRVPMVERIFGSIRGLIQGFDTENRPESQLSTNNTSRAGWIEFRYDDGNLRFRETPENIDVLINVLQARKSQLRAN